MPTYTENVKGGVSTITCDWCGEKVTAELRHEREHAEGKKYPRTGPGQYHPHALEEGVEAREGE
jgi:hypothetical protein